MIRLRTQHIFHCLWVHYSHRIFVSSLNRVNLSQGFFVSSLNRVDYLTREKLSTQHPAATADACMPFKTSHSCLNFSPCPRILVGVLVGSVKTGSRLKGIFCSSMGNTLLESEKCRIQKQRNMCKDFSRLSENRRPATV